MKIDELYPSRFIKATDLHGRPALHVVERVTLEEFDDGETKPAVHLQGTKPLILNRTNAALIAGFLGDDTDAWRGKQIVLYPAKVDFRGKLVDSIRVREPKVNARTQPAAPAAPAAPVPADDTDDVPF